MSAFTLTKLWSANSNYAVVLNSCILQKYIHLIKWKKEASILEIGFADGKNSSETLGPLLPKDYKEFVGTDISTEMVEQAKTHFKIPRSKISQLDVASAVPSDFKNRFDHVFGFNVIHFVKNPKIAFKNIKKMLKPGGSAFLSFFERMPCDHMFDNLTRHPKWRKYGQDSMLSPYFYLENPKQEFQEDLETAKFKNYIFEPVKLIYPFSSVEECNNLFTAVNVILPRIPKDEHEEYLKEYLNEIENSPHFIITHENGQKKISVDCISYVVIATK